MGFILIYMKGFNPVSDSFIPTMVNFYTYNGMAPVVCKIFKKIHPNIHLCLQSIFFDIQLQVQKTETR